MSEKRGLLGPDEAKRRAKLKFDIIAVAAIDPALGAGEFRFLCRVLAQLDLATWTATLGDDRLTAELPECRNRRTATNNRTAIRAAGYFEFDPGSGRHPSRYHVVEELPAVAIARIAARREEASEAVHRPPLKMVRGAVHRPRKPLVRVGLQIPDTGVHRPPVQVSYQGSGCRPQNQTQDVRTCEPQRCACGQPAVRCHRLRPSPAHPNGTPWKYECATCLDDDDRIPMVDDEFRELAQPEAEASETAARNLDAAYRLARDGG